MANILKNDWKDLLDDEFNKEYYQKLRNFLTTEYKTRTIYPDKYDIFNALHFTSYKDIKVVILGQDPTDYIQIYLILLVFSCFFSTFLLLIY